MRVGLVVTFGEEDRSCTATRTPRVPLLLPSALGGQTENQGVQLAPVKK
jgi:hypothetical protein